MTVSLNKNKYLPITEIEVAIWNHWIIYKHWTNVASMTMMQRINCRYRSSVSVLNGLNVFSGLYEKDKRYREKEVDFIFWYFLFFHPTWLTTLLRDIYSQLFPFPVWLSPVCSWGEEWNILLLSDLTGAEGKSMFEIINWHSSVAVTNKKYKDCICSMGCMVFTHICKSKIVGVKYGYIVYGSLCVCVCICMCVLFCVCM